MVDNNYGYVYLNPLPLEGYKNSSLRYFNIKSVSGFNIYCSNESIGACIFKNGTMFSVLDMEHDDFFGMEIPQGTSVSIVSAIQVKPNTIYIAAVANISPSIDKVVYSSKTFDVIGGALSISTTIQGSLTPDEVQIHDELYNDDGSWTGEDRPVTYYTYEGYNESFGFSDVKTKEIYLEGNTDNALFLFCDEVLDDIKGLLGGVLDSFSTNTPYAIDMVYIGEVGYLISVSKDNVKTSIIKDGVATIESKEFSLPNERTDFSNVYSGETFFLPSFRKLSSSEYDLVYVPPGVFFRPKKYDEIQFNRIESIDGKLKLIAYSFSVKYKDENSIVVPIGEDEKIPIGGTAISDIGNIDNAANVFVTKDKRINIGRFNDEDIAGNLLNTRHYYAEQKTLPHQEVDVKAIRSMCIATEYK